MRVKIGLWMMGAAVIFLLLFDVRQLVAYLLGCATIFALAAAQAWDIKSAKERTNETTQV